MNEGYADEDFAADQYDPYFTEQSQEYRKQQQYRQLERLEQAEETWRKLRLHYEQRPISSGKTALPRLH